MLNVKAGRWNSNEWRKVCIQHDGYMNSEFYRGHFMGMHMQIKNK